VSQVRVHKQPRPRRRGQAETPDAEQRYVDERTGLTAPGRDPQSSPRIYRWLGLPSWKE
jgi:hypothetical protein